MKNILIFGAGVAGTDVLREIKRNPELEIRVLGFLDDDPAKQGRKVSGIKILGGRKDLQTQVGGKKIDEVIIAIPSAAGEDISQIVELCSEARVGFKIVPRVKEIIEGRAYLSRVREVRVEDLLGRPVVKADVVGLKRFFRWKKVLVTGAAGSIGSELSRQIAAYRPKGLIVFDWWENGLYQLQLELTRDFPEERIHYIVGNIQDREKVRWVMQEYKPDYVFHAAAYKHVPLMEENCIEAVKNNIFGTLNVAREASRTGVEKFVLVSTDKAANPVSVMGTTKLIAEAIVKNLNGATKFITVRFGNVLDSFGSVVPVFRRQIELGGPVTVTHKRMTRYFMTIPEAAQLILKAALIGRGDELFVLDMGEPVRILDLAEDMIRLSGLVPDKDIKIVFIGARKGEKITEQLFNEKEKFVSTKEDKIFRTESLGLSPKKLPSCLRKLQIHVKNGDEEAVREEFARLLRSS